MLVARASPFPRSLDRSVARSAALGARCLPGWLRRITRRGVGSGPHRGPTMARSALDHWLGVADSHDSLGQRVCEARALRKAIMADAPAIYTLGHVPWGSCARHNTSVRGGEFCTLLRLYFDTLERSAIAPRRARTASNAWE